MASKSIILTFVIVQITCSYSQPQVRIVGGKSAVPGQFPYQVSLQWGVPHRTSDQHFCGGSILNEKWILTAAHCIQETFDQGRVIVKAGKHNISGTEYGEQHAGIKRTFVHPKFATILYDIALILLSRPLVLNKNVSKIDLPRQGLMQRGYVTLSGWGSVSNTSRLSMPGVLQYATLPIINLSSCKKAAQSLNPTSIVHNTNICTGPLTGGLSPCLGDSGGPLVFSRNGKPVVIGIASWVFFPCGTYGAPSVYTRTSAFTSWITQIMKNNS